MGAREKGKELGSFHALDKIMNRGRASREEIARSMKRKMLQGNTRLRPITREHKKGGNSLGRTCQGEGWYEQRPRRVATRLF